VLFGKDEEIASHKRQLERELPTSKVRWQAHKQMLQAQQAAWNNTTLATSTRSPKVAQAELPGPGSYDIEVVGESHHQKELEIICGGRSDQCARVKTTAILVLEDDNPYDSKAVRVEIGGYTVGHLSRENARQYRKRLKEAGHPCIIASCKALIVGGWDRGDGDRGHFGVRLDLPTNED
jgi:hypothetical protein